METIEKTKSNRKRHIRKNGTIINPRMIAVLVFSVGVVIMSITLLTRFSSSGLAEGEKEILTSSTLIEAINISELSTAEFTYNGIAQKFKDESNDKLLYSIRYNAVVKAGIDMTKVKFDIDDEKKTISPVLPEIKITAAIVGNKKLDFIPDDTDIVLKKAMALCEEDALTEATESGELYEIAEGNLKATIEALTYPLVHSQGYDIVWN